MALVVITAPAVEPVTLAQFKTHARIDHDDENALIEAKLVSARKYVERFIGRPLISTTYELVYDAFPVGSITLPKAPLRSVTSVKYVAAATSLEATLSEASYTADIDSDPGRIVPPSAGWPATADVPNAVRIRFIAGYGDAPEDVPEPLREAILQLAAQLFEHREAALYGESAASIPHGVGDILSAYREWSF